MSLLIRKRRFFTGMIVHRNIRIRGIVQGVGFRPFVYKQAKLFALSGYVYNDTEGVYIEIEGEKKSADDFTASMTEKAPPLSYVIDVSAEDSRVIGMKGFQITESRHTDERSAFYSPDVAVCDECLAEFFDPDNRRYHYPFITCINCGPRFSIISDIPYDRSNTTMDCFPLCKDCAAEYRSPDDRRFHAQPTACGTCGPHLSFYDISGRLISEETDAIASRCNDLLAEGSIIAMKGMGGYLLACDAESDSAVSVLRKRKHRPFKPFAVMAGSIESAEKIAYISEKEKELLLSKERPIVLLRLKDNKLSSMVAPELSTLGVMLPYLPFHYLLFEGRPDQILVMTSGNLSNEPIIFSDSRAFSGFRGIADYILTYNREIIAQNDDSVMFVENEEAYFVRRSRGFVPQPFLSSWTDHRILAVGGDLKNTFAVARRNFTIVSQHMGDMADPLTQDAFKKSVDHYMHIFDAKPDVIVSDMHPAYMTVRYCDELSGGSEKRISVQHHHAHIASVIEEYALPGPVLGIAFDGTGYGTDGKLWGSEFLIADLTGFTRAAHFDEFALPGGENAIRDVWKIGLSLLYSAFERKEDIPLLMDNAGAEALIEIMNKRLNCPMTCSIGRLFDGVSAILGLRKTITTEAEAATVLEEAASKGSWGDDPFIISFSEKGTIRTAELIKYLCSILAGGADPCDAALAFHLSIAHTACAAACSIREKTGITDVALSGGVFLNRILQSTLKKLLCAEGFSVYISKKLPVNDGCISAGQIAVARALLKTEEGEGDTSIELMDAVSERK